MAQTSTHHSTDVALILETAGVEITKIGEREITGKCPVHIRTVGREDRSPSWSINSATGLWICFSCGARGTLSSLLYELIGDRSISAQQFLVNAGVDRLMNPKNSSELAPVIDPEKFFKFDRVNNERCRARNLEPDLVYRFGIRWNRENKSWAIPIISPKGALKGWQEKKTDWVRNFPVGVKKGETLFGIERFIGRTAVLVESPLDVVRFAGVFKRPCALASFGAHVTYDQMQLLLHVADAVVIAMDNDDAGIKSSQSIYKIMSSPRRGIKWWNYSGTSAKDIGDMTDDEIESGLKSATVVPPWIEDVQR